MAKKNKRYCRSINLECQGCGRKGAHMHPDWGFLACKHCRKWGLTRFLEFMGELARIETTGEAAE